MIVFAIAVVLIAAALVMLWDWCRETPTDRTTFDTAAAPTVFGASTGATFEVNRDRRTIYGLAVPFGEPTHSDGQKFQFARGVIGLPADVGRIKLRIAHAPGTDVGYATELTETEEGLWARFAVARGAKGDEALQMAEDRVWDGLSIGLRDGAKFAKRGGVHHFSTATLAEISLTPDPAFSSARVAAVTASAPTPKGNSMPCSICGTVHAEGVAPCVAAAAPVITEPAPVAFDAQSMATAIATAFAALPGPSNISAGQSTGLVVTEAPVYAFDAASQLFVAGVGDHDFSTDLINGLKGDREAYERALGFVQTQFAVTTPNAVNANYPDNRPEMYVQRKDYRYPLWDAIKKGNLTDAKPFLFPKYNSSATLVGPHTEGVEPTPGSFSMTSQTVSPSALSGKVEITREVWDMGGNPQVSNLIWAEMVRGWNEALEASVSTGFNAEAANITDVLLTTAASGSALVNEVLAKFVAFQFERGGFRYTDFAGQVDFYSKMATAVDTTGKQILPYLGATNAPGTSGPRLAALDVQGVPLVPAWALAASSANAANSWLFDRSAVHGWASVPQRLTFEYRVALVDLAIWGYRAFAVSDTAGVRQFIYDPVA